MCISPHEMKSSTIELNIAELEDSIQRWPNASSVGYWQARVESFREMLKDRADRGVYETEGQY